MPRLELVDAWGVAHRCDTSDPGVVAAWLLEHARNAVTPDASNYPAQLRVWPMASGQRGPDGQPAYDWPAAVAGAGGSLEFYLLTAGALQRLAAWLEAERGGGRHPEPIPSPEGM